MAMMVQIDDRGEAFVRQQLATGRYRDAEHVVSEALALRRISPQSKDELREMLDRGMKDIEEGRTQPLDGEKFLKEVKDRWRQHVTGPTPPGETRAAG